MSETSYIMIPKSKIKRTSRLRITVQLVLTLAIILVAVSVFGGYSLLGRIRVTLNTMEQNQIKVTGLERMIFLDEILSQSLKIYLIFEDEKYLADYLSGDDEMTELQKLMSEYEWSEAIAPMFAIGYQSDSSVFRLERLALELRDQGEKDSAIMVVTSDKYEAYRKSFGDRLERVRVEENLGQNSLANLLAISVNRLRDSLTISILVVGLILLILAVLGYIVFGVLNRSEVLYEDLALSISKERDSEETQKMLLNDLKEYANLTSHSLRAPIARMQGVITLIGIRKDELQLPALLSLLDDSAAEMDEITKQMNDILTRNSYEKLIND